MTEPPHILVLGGAGEGRTLAARLAARPDLRVTLSLAGRTRAPDLPPAFRPPRPDETLALRTDAPDLPPAVQSRHAGRTLGDRPDAPDLPSAVQARHPDGALGRRQDLPHVFQSRHSDGILALPDAPDLTPAVQSRQSDAILAPRTDAPDPPAAVRSERSAATLADDGHAPDLPACALRVGGFGGAAGLADWLTAHDVAVLVDATHPFARRISANAALAAAAAGVPLVALERPRWQAVPGDDWTRVPDMAAAAAALGRAPRRVFLAIGRQQVAAFRSAPQHAYLVRSIEPVAAADLPPRAETLLARGPFAEAGERALLADRGVEIVVAKNSGGPAAYGKIAAARALGLPVILVDRPPRPDAAPDVDAAIAALDAAIRAARESRG